MVSKKTYRKRTVTKTHVLSKVIAFVLCIAAVSAVSFYCGVRTAELNVSPQKPIKNANSQLRKSDSAKETFSPVSEAVKPVQVSLTDAEKPLWVDVKIGDQTTTVYDAKKRVVESYLCSTGSPGYDTPTGTFSVYAKAERFYASEYKEGAYWAVKFYGNYYFHSVPFDKDNNFIEQIADDLGHKDSHGCVHLSVDNSKWLYDNVPVGAKVVIEN